MLVIYYKYQDKQVIPQYEFENFMLLYQAYKNLHGNSFIDKVCLEVNNWKILKPVGTFEENEDVIKIVRQVKSKRK